MKNLKKAASLILAVMMILSLAVPAFAAPSQGTITITNVDLPDGDNGEYKASKIFDISEGSDGAVVYTINEDSPWFGLVIARVGDDYQSIIDGIKVSGVNGGVYTLTANVLVPGQDAEEGQTYVNATDFVEKATAWYNAHKTEIDAAAANMTNVGGHPTATVDYGYYYVNTGVGALVNVNSASVAVTDKGQNDMPFDKEIDKHTANVGDQVGYKITSKVPDTKEYTKFTYKITDTLDNGLTLVDNIKVVINVPGVGGTEGKTVDLTGNNTIYTKNVNGQTFTLDFNMKALTANKEYVGAELVITYNATVNNNAVAKIEWNNAKLEFTNKGKIETITDKDYVYTYQLVIDKTDGGSNKLAGAQFALKNSNGDYYHVDEITGVVTWGDRADATIMITDENGAADFKGLSAAETYALEEIEAPEGYNKINEDITVILDQLTDADAAGSQNGTVDLTNRFVSTQEVANYSGNLLPETGGIGTTIFYIAGAVLVIGASVLLITRRRMAK